MVEKHPQGSWCLGQAELVLVFDQWAPRCVLLSLLDITKSGDME